MSSARIAQAEIRANSGATRGAANARQSWPERRGLLLVLRDSEGNTGLGEASPLPGYTLDDIAGAEHALRAIDWSRPGPLPHATDALAWVRDVSATVPAASPSARCAAEAALLDLASRHARVPVLRLFGRALDTVPVAHLLKTHPDALQKAKRRREQGVRTFKVKIGKRGAFEAELGFLRSLREQVGDDVALRLDGNQGLGGAGLAAKLLALSELHPELIEEPADAAEMDVLGEGPWTLGLDESLFADPEGTIRTRCREGMVVVLKPMALGGILRCLALAELANAAGARIVVTHTLDGPVGWSVAATLALLVHDPGVAAGLGPHPGLAAWPAQALPGFDGVRIHARDGFGWGVRYP